MPENNSMRTNTPSGDISDEQAFEIVSQIAGSFTLFATEFKSFTKQVSDFIASQKSSTDSIKRLSSSFNRFDKSEKDVSKYIANLTKSVENNIDELKANTAQSKKADRNIDKVIIDKQVKTLESLQRSITKLSENVSLQETQAESLRKAIESNNESIERNQRVFEEMTGESKENARKEIEEKQLENKNLIDRLSKIEVSLSNTKDAIEKEQEKAEKESRNVSEIYGRVKDAFDKSQSLFENAASQSAYISRFLKDNELTEREKFDEMMKNVKDSLERTIKLINEKLEKDISLSDEERKLLIKQRDLAKKELKTVEKSSYAADNIKAAGDKLGEIATNAFKNSIKRIVNLQLDKYMDSYVQGFDKVYSSIEQTRNTISARLRMDSGEYKALQESIYNEIENQGLAGSMTQAEVNEQLVALSSAGITDEEILKALSIESARLQASGSSLNLTNEETLTRIMNQLASGSSMDEIVNQLETIAATEQYSRETFGSDMAFVHGGLDQIVNTVYDMGTAFGKSADEITKDTQSAMIVASQLQQSGVDPNLILNMYKDLAEGKITEGSATQNILRESGLTTDSLASMSSADAMAIISNTLGNILTGPGADDRFLADVLSVYGTDLRTLDAMRLRQIYSNGGINVSSNDLAVSKIQMETESGLMSGSWLSATEKHLNEAANAMTQQAIEAEQLYKGDQGFHAVVDSITDGTKQIVEALEDLAFKTVGDFLHNPRGSGASVSISGADMKAFATGDLSTTAGKLGTGAGIAVGVGLMGKSVIDNFLPAVDGLSESEHKLDDIFEGVHDTAMDPTYWAGVGTTVGTAVGGPVAGAVVGAVMGVGGNIGNALAEKIESSLDPFENAAQSLKDAADELMDNSEKEYEQSKENYEKLKNYTIYEQKQALLNEGNMEKYDYILSRDEIMSATNEEIQKMFKDNILKQEELLMAEKSLKLGTSGVVSKYSTDITNAANLLEDLSVDFEPEDVGSGKWIKSNMNQFVGALGGFSEGSAFSDIYSSIYSTDNMTDSQLKEAISAMGLSVPTSGGRDSLVSAYRTAQLMQFQKTANIDEADLSMYKAAFENKESRDLIYEKADNTFQERWNKAKSRAEDPSDNASIADQYMKDNELSVNWVPYEKYDDGSIHLQYNSGYLDKSGNWSYEGKFKSGLTTVPYDNYAALLHEGERVLTKEEAKSYNKLSSYLMEQTYNNATNSGFSTYINNNSTANTDDLNDSIKSQTSAVGDKLDRILKTLEDLIKQMSVPRARTASDNYNVMMLNSDTTQVATAL